MILVSAPELSAKLRTTASRLPSVCGFEHSGTRDDCDRANGTLIAGVAHAAGLLITAALMIALNYRESSTYKGGVDRDHRARTPAVS